METESLYLNLAGIGFSPIDITGIVALAISLLLLCISALISAGEVAFFSLDPQTQNEISNNNTKSDRKILHLLENPQKLLATILISSNFVNVTLIILLSFFANSVVSFETTPFLGFLLQTILIAFLILLFGEITPKIYATQFAKSTAYKTVGVLFFLEKLLGPFVSLLVNSTSIVNTRLSKISRNNISMNELSQALELTSNSKDEDTEMLEGIIKFGNIQVVDIMTSRIDMVDVDIKIPYNQLLNSIIKHGYSRIPVYSGTRDNIKGILYAKDLLAHIDKSANFRWQSLVRPAYYVPETKKIDDLLSEFQKNKVHLAIVVDEYGGTSGMVTLEDILEEIVGDISDEYDEDEKLFTKIDNHTFIFEAKIQLNDFFKIEEIEENDFSKIADEVETLAGLILEIKGEIPSKNERIGYGRYIFEMLSVDNRRIKKVKLYLKDNFDENDDKANIL